MKVALGQLKKMFVAMGYAAANGWDSAKMTEKLPKLAAMTAHKNAKPLTDKTLAKLHKELTAAGADVQISEEGADAQLAKATTKPAGKAAAKAEAPAGEEKKAGKKKIESAGGAGKPGVIATIVDILTKASEQKPESKETIADKLAAAFPDRDRDSMMKTVSVQVPNRIGKEKGLTIEKARKDGRVWYWIDVVPAGKKGK